MICPKCNSENISVQVVSEMSMKNKGHGALYWFFIGWWLQPILWLLFTLPMIFIKIFKPKKYATKTKHTSMAICQNCGNKWKT